MSRRVMSFLGRRIRPRVLLELEPLDLALIFSAANYAAQVRAIVRNRLANRRRLAVLGTPPNEGLAWVGPNDDDRDAAQGAGSTSPGAARGGDYAAAPGPDYAAEDDRLAANLVSDGAGKRYGAGPFAGDELGAGAAGDD